MAAERKAGSISEYASLKPLTYPVPETRFLHAGMNVYKFKIKYGYTISINADLDESIVNNELQDSIRVVLGNLGNLCPFTTEHFIIFPYLNKWERVSDLRFMHCDEFLIPYPYVCTIYVELNSWKQNKYRGEEEYGDIQNSTKKRNKLRENMDTAMKWRRLEDVLETSYTQVPVNRKFAKNPAHIYDAHKRNAEFERTGLQNDVIQPVKNQPEESKCEHCGSATINNGYDKRSLGECVESNRTRKRKNSQNTPTLQSRLEQRMKFKKKGFLELFKSYCKLYVTITIVLAVAVAFALRIA